MVSSRGVLNNKLCCKFVAPYILLTTRNKHSCLKFKKIWFKGTLDSKTLLLLSSVLPCSLREQTKYIRFTECACGYCYYIIKD